MAQTLDGLLEKLWEDYQKITPQAGKIHDLLKSEGETIVNDHIAFRTYNLPSINIDVLSKQFLEFGYKEKGH